MQSDQTLIQVRSTERISWFKRCSIVCHSAGLHIWDVIAIHWYCSWWTLTSETARTTCPWLLVSAAPQFQTVIAIHLLQGSPHCIVYQVQVCVFAGHIAGSIKVTFRSADSWWCLAVWDGMPSYCRSTCLNLFALMVNIVFFLNFCITLFVITVIYVCPKLLDSVKTFERYKQKCVLAPFLV